MCVKNMESVLPESVVKRCINVSSCFVPAKAVKETHHGGQFSGNGLQGENGFCLCLPAFHASLPFHAADLAELSPGVVPGTVDCECPEHWREDICMRPDLIFPSPASYACPDCRPARVRVVSPPARPQPARPQAGGP